MQEATAARAGYNAQNATSELAITSHMSVRASIAGADVVAGVPANHPSAPAPTIPAERRAEIDDYLERNAFSKSIFDSNGGEIIGAALVGDSSLGHMTPTEQRYLSDRAIEAWATDATHHERITDAAARVDDNPTASRIFAGAMARSASQLDQIEHVENEDRYERSDRLALGRFAELMREEAIGLDPAATLRGYKGDEISLAGALSSMDRSERVAVWDTIADGQIDGATADRLMSASFAFEAENADDFEYQDLRESYASAVAQVTHPGGGAETVALRAETTAKLDAVLATSGGRNLLFGETVLGQTRSWAFEQVISNPDWTADALENGWESSVVTTSLAQQTQEQYAGRGTEGRELTGAALRNTVGAAIGEPADNLPEDDEADAARNEREAAGLDYEYYSDETRAARISDAIEELGRAGALVSAVPITVTSNDYGVATYNVFRVERQDGSVGFVDDQGQRYETLEDWEDLNELPPGVMSHAEGLDPANGLIEPTNTRLVNDTFWEHAASVGDAVALGAGIVAGGVIIFGSGGTATPFVVAAGAGLYSAGRAGNNLYEEHQRGNNVFDLSDGQNRANWLEVAAGTLSLGAIGASLRAANVARSTVQATSSLSRTATTLSVAADTVDFVAMGDQAYGLASNWDQMSNGERTQGMLQIAFFGGLAAASTKAGGAMIRDAFSFSRLSNTMQYGIPYPRAVSPDLGANDIRIAYEPGANGRATKIRIETGDGVISPDSLDRHVLAARHLEAAGGARDRLADLFNGTSQPPPGSAAHEVGLEIKKINWEAEALADELNTGSASPARVAEIERRQLELSRAIEFQQARLDDVAADPLGYIAEPSNGQRQATNLGWVDAPDGYVWLSGENGRPSLYLANGRLPTFDFDPINGRFTDRHRRGERNNLNPDLNPPADNPGAGIGPNRQIEYDNGQVFRTNAEGYPSYASASLNPDDAWVRDESSQRAYGNLGTEPSRYDGGHLLARIFGGAPDRINIVPQASYLNRHGRWRAMEIELKQLLDLDRGHTVGLEVDINYPPGGGATPESFLVTRIVDGVTLEPQLIWNTPDGLKP